ncbi:phosphatidylserine/phosphatidylglycerophosphate/cardiolipin synthase family protein [Pseudoduganella sp.]|uniref:phospholipase D-like domain-containing protein n=1 Tax=Pseudoduganella sp. TaxID=1880898 RepID=UPI0035B3CC5C
MNKLHRTETTYIDEVRRAAVFSLQWQLELRNLKSTATHPISHNNRLQLFICGEQAFSDILARIGDAEASIDLCCWGFDPGMELGRTRAADWPRGPTLGDALIRAGQRGVKVRLLVWYDTLGCAFARNMPGYSHDLTPWYYRRDQQGADEISAAHSIALLAGIKSAPFHLARYLRYRYEDFPVAARDISPLARAEYCHSWYQAAARKQLKGIELRTRSGNRRAIEASLATEKNHPAGLSKAEFEAMGMEHLGSHHQKTILIDYAHNRGAQAIGYVMGLNSVTDYWDTTEHLLEDPRRERGGKKEKEECVQTLRDDPGFRTLKPYQDYACRIDAGRALIEVHENFASAWARAGGEPPPASTRANPPAALLRKALPGDSTVQIVRTQPEERQDKTIKEAYFLATATAATTHGYIYIENQYFQYEEWLQFLLEQRRNTVRQWLQRKKENRTAEDLPVMYVFIVMPVPEREQMIPRTYDALATLGQQDRMTGQVMRVKEENERKPHQVRSGFGTTAPAPRQLPDVVKKANATDKPSALRLENEYGLKVSTVMLNACGFNNGRWRYREIYIHSKLMIVSDAFLTLGSANLNQRSMAVDSELNISICDPSHARDMRQRVWGLLSGGEVTGGNGTARDIKTDFEKWQVIANNNLAKRSDKSGNGEKRALTGFILPLEDDRSSLTRLG